MNLLTNSVVQIKDERFDLHATLIIDNNSLVNAGNEHRNSGANITP